MLEYVLLFCLDVCCSVSSFLLDRIRSKLITLGNGLVEYDLEHRRRIAALCMFHKIRCNSKHTIEPSLTQVHVTAMLTSLGVSVHSRYHVVPRCSAVQFG